LNLSSGKARRSFLLSRAAKPAEPESSLESHRVLLVEDNPADVGLVREALSEHGVDCVLSVITDGESAIDFMEEVDDGRLDCPDLIILDLNLPKRPGRDVLQFIRTSIRCSQVPVLVLSSSGAQKDKDEAAELGASRYIQKPIRLDDFINLGKLFKDMLNLPG
jgi:two-component system, chemotaxis family, response regulator Rcp1